MNQCILSHYMPLIPPLKVKSKALLCDVLEALLMEEQHDLPDEPFHIYYAPEMTDAWCLGEKIGDCINIRFKGKEVKVWYIAHILVIEFDGNKHVIDDNNDIYVDCDIIRGILLGEITTDNIFELFNLSPEEQQVIDTMLARSNGL